MSRKCMQEQDLALPLVAGVGDAGDVAVDGDAVIPPGAESLLSNAFDHALVVKAGKESRRGRGRALLSGRAHPWSLERGDESSSVA